MRKLLHDTFEFLGKGLDEHNTEVLPKVVITVASVIISTAIYHWLPDHDPANGRRAA